MLPTVMPTWFNAVPKASSRGCRYTPLALPAHGIPAASPIPSIVRDASNPPNDRVHPVAIPAADHTAIDTVTPAFNPTRSMNQPGAVSAYTIENAEIPPPYCVFDR